MFTLTVITVYNFSHIFVDYLLHLCYFQIILMRRKGYYMTAFTIITTLLSLILSIISILSQSKNPQNNIINSQIFIEQKSLLLEKNIDIAIGNSNQINNIQPDSKISKDNQHFLYELLIKGIYMISLIIFLLGFYVGWTSYVPEEIGKSLFVFDRVLYSLQYTCITAIRCSTIPISIISILFVYKSFKSQCDYKTFQIIMYLLLSITSIVFFVTFLLLKPGYFMPTQIQYNKNISSLSSFFLSFVNIIPTCEYFGVVFTLYKLVHTVLFQTKRTLSLRINFNYIVTTSLLPTIFLICTTYNIFLLLHCQ